MTDPIARSAPESGAGVLELLRRFKDDQSLADHYAAACLEKAKAAEPVLKAFEYLPVDVTRRPGPLSGIPVAIKDIIATSDMPTTNGSPIYRESHSGARRLGRRTLAQSRRHDLRQDGLDGIRLASPRADNQSLEFRAYAGRLVLGLGRSGRGRHRAAGARHADAGLGDPAGGVQWRRRPQAQFRRHPPRRRASPEPFARSCRLLRPPRR